MNIITWGYGGNAIVTWGYGIAIFITDDPPTRKRHYGGVHEVKDLLVDDNIEEKKVTFNVSDEELEDELEIIKLKNE